MGWMEDNNPTSALDTRADVLACFKFFSSHNFFLLDVGMPLLAAEFRYALAARQVADPDSDHAPMFVPVVADSPKPKSHDVAIEVELGGAVVRRGRTASPGLATAVSRSVRGVDRSWFRRAGDAATRPVDFRKGPDALAALVSAEYGGDPYSGVIYVFRGAG